MSASERTLKQHLVSYSQDVKKATEYKAKAKAKARAFKAKAKAINTSPRPVQGQGHTLQGQGRRLCAEYYLSYKIFLKLNFYIFNYYCQFHFSYFIFFNFKVFTKTHIYLAAIRIPHIRYHTLV